MLAARAGSCLSVAAGATSAARDPLYTAIGALSRGGRDSAKAAAALAIIGHIDYVDRLSLEVRNAHARPTHRARLPWQAAGGRKRAHSTGPAPDRRLPRAFGRADADAAA